MPDRDPGPSTTFTFSLFPSMVVQKDVDGYLISADLDYHTIFVITSFGPVRLCSILFRMFFLSSMFLGVSFEGFSSMAQSGPWCV